MHISEGVLSTPVLFTGVAITVAGCAVGFKKMDYDRIPQVAFLKKVKPEILGVAHAPIKSV